MIIFIAIVISALLAPSEKPVKNEIVIRVVFDNKNGWQGNEWVMAKQVCDKCEGSGSLPSTNDVDMIICDKCYGSKVTPIACGLSNIIIPVDTNNKSDFTIHIK